MRCNIRSDRLCTAGVLLVYALSALPAPAATPFQPPEGCRLELTVQLRGCTVSQHYRCAGDPDGDQRTTYIGQNGPEHVSRIDRQTRWMESTDPRTGLRDTLVPDAKNDASLDTLLRTGRDDFDFWTQDDDGVRLHNVGFDELTGETVSIDGVDLDVTRFELVTTDETGAVLISRKGQQFISRSQRRFYGGVETADDWTGASVESNDTPVEFAFPGQPGFGATAPRHDCDLLTS